MGTRCQGLGLLALREMHIAFVPGPTSLSRHVSWIFLDHLLFLNVPLGEIVSVNRSRSNVPWRLLSSKRAARTRLVAMLPRDKPTTLIMRVASLGSREQLR